MKTVIRNIINTEMKKRFAFHIIFLYTSFAVLKYVCLTTGDDAGTTVVEI